ncbi:MAG TPA: protein kinase [Pyrinomonadaceae bacterium]|jgi:serine/threonine protein kinase
MFRATKKLGQYTLVKKLAKGGFGEVWLAEKQSPLVTKKVAIKLPHDEQVDFETIKREAQLWEEASGHPNVLPLIDADVYEGQVVIVSEYIEDGSLADKLKKEGSLPVRQAVEIAIGILNGLEYLHSKNIVHRDIKPANILLQGDTPRLADFGISRALQVTSVSSKIVGTESYMSPESFEGVRSMQTDIWSVGIVLYKTLSGFLPFMGTAPAETMYSILTREPEPLPDEIPPRLREIVFKALEKDRNLNGNPPRRYQSAAEMREDLRNFLDNFSETAAPSANETFELLPADAEESRATRYKMRIPLKKSDSWQRVGQLKNSPKAVLFLVLGLSGVIALMFVYLFGRSSLTDSRASEASAVEQTSANSAVDEKAVNASKEFYREGDKFYSQRNYKKAIEAYTRGIELNPNDSGLYNNRGIAYHIMREFEKAIADYTKAAELNPNHFSAYNNRGLVYQEMGNKEQAVADFRKALELDPENKLAKDNLEKILK